MPSRKSADDAAAWEHYDDAANRQTKDGPARRPPRPSLSAQVPIRFDPRVVAAVGRAAEGDGMSVSSWIRHVVDQELARRAGSSSDADPMSAQAALESARRALVDLERALPRPAAAGATSGARQGPR